MKVVDVCPHYPSGVPDGHKCDARYVLVGEAPGEQERRKGLPFVGPSYWRALKPWWDEVGIKREEIYITNVLDFQPPGNKIETVDHEILARGRLELINRLRTRLTNPHVIIPVGGTSLYALTGKTNITKWRGSILEADMLGPGRKCIPSLHPAYALRSPVLAKTCKADWRKIKREAKYADIRLPTRNHIIFPDAHVFNAFKQQASQKGVVLTIDIETDTTSIICVGFALTPDESITIMWDTAEHIGWIKELCSLLCEKNLQRGLYDLYWLTWFDCPVVNWVWSVDAMFHCLDPCAGPTIKSKKEDDEEGDTPAERKSSIKPYSLSYMASIFCPGYVFWKDEAKDSDDSSNERPSGQHLRDFLTYNGKDNTYTSELQVIFRDKLISTGKLEFYLKHYAALYYPLLDLMLHGTQIDVPGVEKNNEYLARQMSEVRCKCEALAGRPLHSISVGASWFLCDKCKGRHRQNTCPRGGKTTPIIPITKEGTSISQQKLKEYLYGKRVSKNPETGEVCKTGNLGLPPRRKKGKVTTEEAALRTLRIKYPDKAGSFCDGVLEFRRVEKLGTFLAEGKIDSDGRLRCQYNQTILTGRLSSSASPRHTGTNKQNIDRELRQFFLPDKGTIFLEPDLSQAEDRVQGVLTGDPELIRIARTMPDEFDVHKYRAAKLYHCEERQITDKQRYLGKRVKHAVNFGMQAAQFQRVMLTADEPMFVPLDEAQRLLDTLYDDPLRSLHQRIRYKIMRDKVLVNSWGREINYYEERLDEESYKRGYAFPAQSNIGDLLNQWGLLALSNFIRSNQLKSHINEQEHDALLISAYPDEAYDIAKFCQDSLTRPRHYCLGDGDSPVELSIPCEYTIYTDWGKKQKYSWKRLPSRKEFDECFQDLMSKRHELNV